jgi:hypothetical protein
MQPDVIGTGKQSNSLDLCTLLREGGDTLENESERRKEALPHTEAIQQRDSREQEPTTFRDRHHHRRRGGPQIHIRRRRHAAARARGEQPDMLRRGTWPAIGQEGGGGAEV